MKRLVNGGEVDLAESGASVRQIGDRLLVTDKGTSLSAVAVKRGDVTYVSYLGRQFMIEPVRAQRTASSKDHSGDLISPMPGAVIDVLVAKGDRIRKGDKVLILEAMKTQQTFTAPFDGVIAELAVSKGEQVREGLLMASIKPAED